jgi:glycosyltransferase involved in cell wall biosynthesis
MLVSGAMRILLVGNYPLDGQFSMLRYAELLRREMTSRGHEVTLVQPEPWVGRLATGGLRKWLGYIDKFLVFPWRLRRLGRGMDLVHVCDHSNSMYLAQAGGAPVSITCHDLLAVFSADGRYPLNRLSVTGKMLQGWIRRGLTAAANVVCVSESTAAEFRSLGGGPEQRVTVIHNPPNYDFRPSEPEAVRAIRERLRLAPDETYLLHVGGNQWYKNRPGVVRIYHGLLRLLGDGKRPRLVLAGKPWPRALREYVAANGLGGKVLELVGPSNEELRALYTGALALVFPSLHEGFGWPIIEAQSCGCPVVTSNRSTLAEVGGGALLIDPEDEAGAAAILADNLGRLSEFVGPGFENVKRFDKAAIMQRYEEFFMAVAGAAVAVDSAADTTRVQP